MDGLACYPCPTGARCNETVRRATETIAIDYGTTSPRTSEGFYLFTAPATKHKQNCDPAQWKSDDPCKLLTDAQHNLTDVLHTCSLTATFKSYWSADRIFSCLSNQSFYACDVSGGIDLLSCPYISITLTETPCLMIAGNKRVYRRYHCRAIGPKPSEQLVCNRIRPNNLLCLCQWLQESQG